MTNVIDEILYDLEQNGFKEEDISWIGSMDRKYALAWKEFKEKFRDIEYDSGFGGQELASDLVMVMNDGTFFDRSEYDGAESWQYHKTPKRSYDAKPYDYICVSQVSEIGWKSLEDLNSQKPVACVTCGNPHLDKGYTNGNCFSCHRRKESDFYQKYNRFPKDGEIYRDKKEEND